MYKYRDCGTGLVANIFFLLVDLKKVKESALILMGQSAREYGITAFFGALNIFCSFIILSYLFYYFLCLTLIIVVGSAEM